MDDSRMTRRDFLETGLALGALGALTGIASAADPPAAGRLTIHAIDTFHGSPGGGMKVDFSILDGGQYRILKSFDTAPNGRTVDPLLAGEALKPGRYELLFHFDSYFARTGAKLPNPTFLSKVPIRFGIADAGQRYHIAILFSPWGYAYYRGS